MIHKRVRLLRETADFQSIELEIKLNGDMKRTLELNFILVRISSINKDSIWIIFTFLSFMEQFEKCAQAYSLSLSSDTTYINDSCINNLNRA